MSTRNAKKIESDLKEMGKKVDAGIKFLNKHFGKKDWLKKIKIADLNLGERGVCVLGFALGDYFRGLEELKLSQEQSEQLGFYVNPYAYADTSRHQCAYDMLTYVWFTKLTALKKKAAAKKAVKK